VTSAQRPGDLSETPTEILGDHPQDSASDELFLGPSRVERGKEGKGAFWRELPVLVVMALVLALLIKTFLVQAFFIPSESMVRTLEPGDRVLVNKVIYRLRDPGRGDVIVFEDPHPKAHEDRGVVAGFFGWISRGMGLSQAQDEDFIKRIIGLPGETVEGRDGSVWIDGRKLDEPYLNGVTTENFAPIKVPEGQYFVMGDNRPNSNDSRFSLGTIPRDKIVGEAFVIIWPPGRWGLL